MGDFYGKRPVDPDNFPQRASDESLEEMIERACRRVPKLENAEVMRGVTGVYDMTPDSRPLLGEIPGVAGLLRVCWFFRHGLQNFTGNRVGDVRIDCSTAQRARWISKRFVPTDSRKANPSKRNTST